MLRSQKTDPLETFTKLTEQEHRDLGVSNAIEDFTNFLVPILEDGPIQKSFCFGACDEDDDDPFRKIEGSIMIRATAECDGAVLEGESALVSVSGLAYVVFESFGDEALADQVVDLLGPFGQFGLKEASVGLEAKTNPILKMVVSLGGKPALPTNTFTSGSPGHTIYSLIEDVADGLNFGVVGTLLPGEASVEFQVSVDPIIVNNAVQFNSTQGLGPSIFTKTRFVSGSGTEVIFGLRATLRILVAESDEGIAGGGEDTYIYLTGQIVSAVTNGVVSFGGQLALQGWWYNMFGLPFFHLGNAVAGVSLTPIPGPPFVSPKSVIFGASLCIGAKQLCEDGDLSETIFLMSYISVDAAFPVNNYFVALANELTADSILTAFGNVEGMEIFADLNDKLPAFLKNTGFTPLKECVEVTAEQLRDSSKTIDRDCFVSLSFAPFGAVADIVPSTPDVELELPQGIAFAGQVNLFDLVIFRLETRISIQQAGLDLVSFFFR